MLAGCKPGVTRHYLQEVPAKPAKASDVLLTSLSHVPGYYIRTTGGVDCRWLSFDDNQNYQKLFSGAMAGLQKDALKGGYNAVVNFRVSNGTWEAQGSAWRVLMTQLCGDDVEVARK
jgi:hypothetical protein